MAVQLCARKVAAVAGDIRKALDVCRRAVEAVENDVRRQTVLTTVSGKICSISKQGRGLFFLH